MAAANKKDQVPAIARAMAVLDFISRKPGASFTAIHTELGLPKSSAYLLVKSLVSHGILRVSSDGGYTLGLRLYELGMCAVSRFDIRKEALPLMQKLVDRVRLTCHLGILEGMESVYLAKVECDQAVVVKSWEGKRVSLSSSALGKSLLLAASPEKYNELVSSLPFHRSTPKSITSRKKFLEHMEEARRKGWTIDDEEAEPGIRCVGAPVYGLEDQPVSLSLAGPSNQVPFDRVEDLAEELIGTARELAQIVGLRASTRRRAGAGEQGL